MENKTPIRTFKDLVVYQNLYKAMLRVNLDVIPKLPMEEKYDLVSQVRRGSKAGPALIAEGFAKRYQKRQWKKYVDDTIGECYEMIHHLTVCLDLYSDFVDSKICNEVIDIYDISTRQLKSLKNSWQNYHEEKTNN